VSGRKYRLLRRTLGPAVTAGEFSVIMRLYWPKQAALDGSWKPPAVKLTQ